MSRLARVSLSKHRSKIYTYWYLRWSGSDSRQRGECIGRADGPNRLSRRQAEVKRSRKEQEINDRPGRRDASGSCTLSKFLEGYLASRETELTPNTLKLYSQTAKYLLAYFGSNRRINHITKAEARGFKTALASGDLSKTKLRPATMNKHIRQARAAFAFAMVDEIIISNPFDKLGNLAVSIERDWHYVTLDEYRKLINAAPNNGWQLLISLCRLAGLRRGETLNLEWSDLDWENCRLRIIAKETWQPKDKSPRFVPICPELYKLLLSAYSKARDGQIRVIAGLCATNLCRDFAVLCRKADIQRYAKPFHTLRRNCITDWAAKHPAHVVREWAGHSNLETTNRYYLQVSELEYKRAAGINSGQTCTTSCTTQRQKKELTERSKSI